MKKTWSVTNLIVIILLAASSFVSAKGILEMRSMRLVESWLSDKPKMYTAQLTDSQKDKFVAVLREFSEERGFTAVSRNRESLQSGSALYTFSVLVPDSAEGADFEPLDLLGTRVVDGSVAREISAANPGSYAGYGNDAFSRVETLPSIRAGLYFRVDRLESGSSLGRTCTVIGLDDGEFQTLVNDLSSAIGVSADSLTTEMSGSATDMGLIYWFCEGAFVVLAIVLCLLTVTHSLLELRTLGVHLMLGWSRRAFAAELIANQAAFLPRRHTHRVAWLARYLRWALPWPRPHSLCSPVRAAGGDGGSRLLGRLHCPPCHRAPSRRNLWPLLSPRLLRAGRVGLPLVYSRDIRGLSVYRPASRHVCRPCPHPHRVERIQGLVRGTRL